MERKNPLSTGDGKVNKTELLASRSFSNQKAFKDRGRAWQIRVGEEKGSHKQRHPNMVKRQSSSSEWLGMRERRIEGLS